MSKYFLLKGIVEKESEKAIGVITGCNNSVIANNLRYYYTFIPKSIVKEVKNNIYIPMWFINENNALKNEIDFSDSIDVEETKTRKPRKTKEEKAQEQYNQKLDSFFNGETPSEYIEIWIDAEDLRFQRIEQLEKTMRNIHKYEKVIILRNGIKEVIK